MSTTQDWIRSVREADNSRADFPGEHLLVLGVGIALMVTAGRGDRSFLSRALIGALAGAFIGRAASGSGGVARLASLINQRRLF
ncbi:hypothetical protein [Variovorax sp.]|uniref:hypothetical protein n=1 Tax=Variovorax sp. TaxID=1871043 RepID=UPI002D753811|nr:hypothetical protein [Variovorax sp.]HYP83153.1 hypothetical protein [Variovorax sp.]